MKKIIKKIVLVFVGLVWLLCCVSLLYFSLVAGFLFFLIPFALTLCNFKVKQTNWWKNKFIDTDKFMPRPKFRADYTRNYSVINTGSQSAKFSLFYQGVSGLNLSNGVQSLPEDFNLLKFYHSY